MASVAQLPQPPTGVIADKNGNVQPGWYPFFSTVQVLLNLSTQAGTTASRPSSQIQGRWIGMPYYDTSLGIPVYLASINPDVWKSAAGAPV